MSGKRDAWPDATTHEIYNKGEPHPKLETFQDLKHALVKAGILRL